MSFTDHKITAFTHKVSDLPDEPQIPAADLKSRFDACPEELRQSLNAVCDDADALEVRVDGHDTQINQISMEKFPDDTIQEKNLHPDLASKLNGKADQTALAAEAAAREATDTEVAKKCEIYFGTYTGDGTAERFIDLGFTPKAVYSVPFGGRVSDNTRWFGGFAMQNRPVINTNGNRTVLQIETNGFRVFNDGDQMRPNSSNGDGYAGTPLVYYYIAFR